MSKITFRADDELIDRLEEFDASKSEVMREALREFLGEGTSGVEDQRGPEEEAESIDDLIVERVDAIIEERVDDRLDRHGQQDVNVNISLDGREQGTERAGSAPDPVTVDERDGASHAPTERKTGTGGSENASERTRKTCPQCGENVADDHVYCPNCGEKASRRVFCECGDELRSDWGFCPGCGRRTPAADVLDNP